MKKLIAMVRSGPVIVGEFRGGKAEIAKRFDKSDKNAAPIEFGMYKFNLELLADGSPVMVSVFLDAGIKAEEFRRIADEESICLRIHSSEDASAKSETVSLDVYVSGSPFDENSDGTVES